MTAWLPLNRPARSSGGTAVQGGGVAEKNEMTRLALRNLILAVLSLAIVGCAKARREKASATEIARRPVLLFTSPPFRGALHDPLDPIEFCFSKLIDPESIRPGLAHLSSGSVNLDSEIGLDLVDYQHHLGFRPFRRACPGSVIWIRSVDSMAAGALYRVRLFDEIRDWQGRKVNSTNDRRWLSDDNDNRRLYLEFLSSRAGEARPNSPRPSQSPPDPPRTIRELFRPPELFSPQNPSCNCHRDPQSLAYGRLNLSSPEIAHHALLHGKSESDQPWVDPGYPEHSYLIHKLLRDEEGHALPGVIGDPMPPEMVLDHRDLATLMAWIKNGANY